MHSESVTNKIRSYLDLHGTKRGLAFWCVPNEAPNKRWYIHSVQDVAVYVHHSQMCQPLLAHSTSHPGLQSSEGGE